MVMIFTLVGMAQDKLVELMDSVKELQEQENRQKQEELKRKEEVAINKAYIVYPLHTHTPNELFF